MAWGRAARVRAAAKGGGHVDSPHLRWTRRALATTVSFLPHTPTHRPRSLAHNALTPPAHDLPTPLSVTPWSGRQELYGETSLVPASNPGDEGVSSVTAHMYEGRVAKIAMPPKHAMQSATSRIKFWEVKFDRQRKWRNELMGWTSGSDVLRTHKMRFESKEEAMAFCDRQGWKYEVEEPAAKADYMGKKDYGDNFLTARAKTLYARDGEAHFNWAHVGKVRLRRVCARGYI